MKRIVVLALLCVGTMVFAQDHTNVPPSSDQQKAQAPVNSEPTKPVATSQGVFFTLPTDLKVQIRDLQHERDQIEIDNQRMLVQLEKNHQRQTELVDSIKQIAFQYAQSKNIDLGQFDFDLNTVQFKQKQK